MFIIYCSHYSFTISSTPILSIYTTTNGAEILIRATIKIVNPTHYSLDTTRNDSSKYSPDSQTPLNSEEEIDDYKQ